MSNSAFTPSTNYANAATPSNEGLVNTGAQTFGGVKTFQDGAVIKGVTDGSTGSSGDIGYALSGSRLASSALSLTTATAADVCGISVPAGEWMLSGYLGLKGTATSVTITIASYGTGAAATPPEQERVLQIPLTANLTTSNLVLALPSIQISRTGANTDYNIRAYVTFTGGTCTAYGAISARRMR